VAKSRRPTRRRQPVSAKRKPASRKRTSAKKRPPRIATTDGAVELKPIRDAIARAVDALKLMPPRDAIKITIERLERCLVEFDAACDDKNPDNGCGTTMTFWP